MLCDYGCGKEAKFLMTSGKWCCEDFYTKCSNNRKKNSCKNLGKLKTEKHKKNISRAKLGKTYEEMMGEEKAKQQKELRRNQGKLKIGDKNPMFGKHQTNESIQKTRIKITGKNNYGWKGGLGSYLHQKAKEMFGLNYCEKCKIPIEKYLKNHKINFDMHCTSKPKDYSIMEKSNWKCLCRKCHREEENIE